MYKNENLLKIKSQSILKVFVNSTTNIFLVMSTLVLVMTKNIDISMTLIIIFDFLSRILCLCCCVHNKIYLTYFDILI